VPPSLNQARSEKEDHHARRHRLSNPTCQAPACILDRWTWGSRHGPVEHVKTGRERGQYQAALATANDPYWRNRFMSAGERGSQPVPARRR
jgi:hypothetical protein